VSLLPSTAVDPLVFEQLLEAIPGFVFLVDGDVTVLKHNSAAGRLLGFQGQDVLRHRGGDLLHCVHSANSGGCGTAGFCRNCVIRSCVTRALEGTQAVRHRFRLELVSGATRRELYVLVSASALSYQGERVVLLILEDIAELMQLHQLLPICIRCKSVRSSGQSWNRVESYLQQHMDLLLTNCYCPACLAQQKELAELGQRISRLTRREYEVFNLVIRGRLNKQIAACLDMAEKTVKIHRSRVMAKMQVQSVAELVHAADRLELLRRSEEEQHANHSSTEKPHARRSRALSAA
jgi:DNA-binding CsgD family transcriptional regulator